MAKTRIYMPEPMFGPCLLVVHAIPEISNVDFDFHAIALWDAPTYNPWTGLYWTPGQVDYGWPEYPDPSPYQLQLALALIRDPAYISDTCMSCNSRWGVPRAIRWYIHRTGIYPYHVPTCAWDGEWPTINWTPDQWPPAKAY